MAKRPDLSKGEIAVARAVWKLGEATVGAVHEEVCRKDAMDYATVQTYLRRMEAKGYLKTKRVGRHKCYMPKVKARSVIRGMVADLIDRLFDGETLAMMNHLVIDHALSEEELSQLRRLLDEREESNDVS